jgi:hypothetical protein
MEFKPVESLRRAKLDERDAAAQVAAPKTADQYSWFQKSMWCGVQALRHAWLNIYPLLALVVGVVFVVYVKQTREILAGMQQHWLVLGVLAVWAASIWYSMRVLSSTDFPGDADPHPASKGCTGWLNAETPRLAAFFGLVVIACASSIFLFEPDPSPHWIAPLAAGIVPVAWAVAWVGDRIAGLLVDFQEKPVYRWSTLLVALAAAAIASYSWSTVPQPMRSDPNGMHLEDWLLGITIVLTLVPLLVRRTGAVAHWAMAGALAVWAWVVYRTAISHPGGSTLPFLILAFAAFGLWFTQRRRELLSIKQDAGTPRFEVGGKTFIALGVAFALQLVLVVALTLSPIGIGMRLGTVAILFLALALLAFFGMVWVFVPKYVTWPSLALVPIVWYLALGNMPDHTLRETKFAQKEPGRPRLAAHFDKWRAQLPNRDDSPIFFVAAAGGGLRAAYWTATMLATADDQTCGEFGRHVYAYSGVSGGSLGISAYLAQRQVWEAKPPAERCQPGRRAEIVELLRRDFLAPVAGSLLFAEMTQRFVPFDYLEQDRGSVLAKAWSRAWDEVFPDDKGRFDRPFLEVFAAKDNRPAVFLNATAVQSGRRAIASNIQVRLPDGIDLFRPVQQVALRTSGLTLREAVLNSARFTYVSPAGTVHECATPKPDGTCSGDTKIWDLLVDGGYFENSGVATLSDVVRALAVARERVMAETKKDPGPRKDQMFFIVIDNSNESQLACRDWRKPAGQVSASGPAGLLGGDGNEDAPPGVAPVSGLTAPIEALLHVREARGQLEVRRLGRDFNCKEGRLVDWNLFGDQANKAQAQAAGQEPALGWFLSRRSAKWIGKRAVEVAGQFPFRHAACHTGKLPTDHVKTVVGERSQSNVVCIEPVKALKP